MRIAMMIHKSVVHDSRVRREASALAAAGHDVVVVELAEVGEPRLDGFRRRSSAPPPWVRRRLPRPVYRALFLGSFVRVVVDERPDVVHAHDAAMLLPALVVRRLLGVPIVYDTHELATSVPYRDRAWARFVAWVERVGVARSRAVITVSDGIAERLVGLYGLRSRPTVVRNVTDLAVGPPVYDLRGRLGLEPDVPVVLHQGAPAPDRGCEALIRAVPRLRDGVVVFLGDGDPAYIERLRALGDEIGCAERIVFLPSVPVHDLLGITAQATVGVSLLEDTCENHRLALPNKLFEYLAAGVPVVVSDLPEIATLVGGLGVGRTARPGDPAAIAAALAGVLAERAAYSARIGAHAHALPRWQREVRGLIETYAALEST